jgi:predicted outer membrane protein
MAACKYTALLLSLVCANFALAQNATQEQRNRNQSGQIVQPGQAGQPGQRQVGQAGRLGAAGQGGEMDTLIASCLLLGNQEEVTLAQLAVDRAENENVKQFAQTLIDDHQKAIQKLQQHAKPGTGLTANSGASPAGQSPTAQQYTARRQDISQGTAGSGLVDQILQMQQEAAQECLSMTKSMMEEKQGAEFDKAFAGMQVGAHVGMLAKLKASEKHASPELASIIKESQQTVEQHLEHAKQLCEQLKDESLSQARN